MSHLAQTDFSVLLLCKGSRSNAICHGANTLGAVVDSGMTVHSRRACVSVREITTIGLRLTISGGMKPRSKSQMSI